jgi:small subunit ribosomal protein S12
VPKRKIRRVYATLKGNPQQRGTIFKLRIEAPKKPNRAKRRVVQVRIRKRKKIIRSKIQGMYGFGTQKFATVLIRGAHPRDLPGIRSVVIRGKFGCLPWREKVKARSKYGVRRFQQS